jgi:hypothetical protein
VLVLATATTLWADGLEAAGWGTPEFNAQLSEDFRRRFHFRFSDTGFRIGFRIGLLEMKYASISRHLNFNQASKIGVLILIPS